MLKDLKIEKNQLWSQVIIMLKLYVLYSLLYLYSKIIKSYIVLTVPIKKELPFLFKRLCKRLLGYFHKEHI